MTARLGVGIGSAEVRAVLVRRGRVAWSASRAMTGGETFPDVIAQMLRSAPLRRFPRTPAIVALGPAFVQVKRLPGVPERARSQTMNQLAKSNASRFFLRNGVPLSVASAHREVDGWWGAAMDTPIVDAVEGVFAGGAAYLEGCVPSLTAIACAARIKGDGAVNILDGPINARLTIRNSRWAECRRDYGGEAAASASEALASRYQMDGRFADAISAALSASRSPLILRSSRSRLGPRQRQAIRGGLACLAGFGLAAALVAPGAAASTHAARDAARLTELRATLAIWSPAMVKLRETSAALNEIGAFAAQRRSIALLLGEISGVLPDSTAIVSLRVDSAGGTMTLLSLSAASIVPRLGATPDILDPKIVGAVTRETVSGSPMQRITVRFALRRGSAGNAR